VQENSKSCYFSIFLIFLRICRKNLYFLCEKRVCLTVRSYCFFIVCEKGYFMNNPLRTTVFFMGMSSFLGSAYGMEQREIVLAQCVRSGAVPILFINDYIVQIPSSYRALKEEMFLAVEMLRDNMKNNKNRGKRIIRKNNLVATPENVFSTESDIRIELLPTEDSMFRPGDFPYICNKLEGLPLCVGNICCGACMLGVVLLLSYCR